MIYVIGYLVGAYIAAYIFTRFIFEYVGTSDEETGLTIGGIILWPFVVLLGIVFISYNLVKKYIKKYINKVFLPMDIIFNSSIYLYKKLTEYVETKYISYKRRGYKPYVQANNNRSNVQSNVR